LLIIIKKNNKHSATKHHPRLFQNTGCATAQPVSSQISTEETWDQFIAVHTGHMVEVTTMGQDFLRVL
jgi:hypothetical protein